MKLLPIGILTLFLATARWTGAANQAPTEAQQERLAQEDLPPPQSHPSILQTHVLLFEELDAWHFKGLPKFFAKADPEKDTPLVFLTDGYKGAHESWHQLDPLQLVKRWALTTGNKTRFHKVQIEESVTSLGYAAIDFERDCPMTSGETVTQKFRVTSVLRFHQKNGWGIIHMHISGAGGDQSGKWDIGVEGPNEVDHRED